MSERKWQDCYLSDVIEAQLGLFFHLSEALDQAGILPRRLSAEALRRTAGREALRPGVASCLRAIAERLEMPDPKAAGNGLSAHGQGANGQGANGQGANGQGANGQGANGQGANGRAANGSLSGGWRPRLVADDDPDCA